MNLHNIQIGFQILIAIGIIFTAIGGFGNFIVGRKLQQKDNEHIVDTVKSTKKDIAKGQQKITDNIDDSKKEILKEIKLFEKTFFDINDKKLDNYKEVEVLEDKIIDAQKGYMRIKVSKDYLNSGFGVPVTLKYKSGRYQPVMLTFTNDKQWGAGVIFTSPEHEKKTPIFLNQCFRFKGGGEMTYTTDLIFELYFNDYCIYFVTNSGEFKFEKRLPPMRYGKNKCIGYFNENNERNKYASSDFSALEAYFNRYK